jgi:hypothetical protein
MRLWRGREIEASSGRQFLRIHLLLPGRSKMRLMYGRESDVSSGGRDLRTHFLQSRRPEL